MDLNGLQKDEVAKWFSAGASLDEIQKRIKSEFGIHLTYLDVRLLVAELPQPEEAGEAGDGESKTTGTPKTPRPEPPEYDQALSQGPESHTGEGEEADLREGEVLSEGEMRPEGEECPEGQALPAPTVTIDALMLPGTIASGDVTFTDGKTGKWYLDQMGRLGIGNLPEGYRPSPTDAALFQQQLMGLLQARGLC